MRYDLYWKNMDSDEYTLLRENVSKSIDLESAKFLPTKRQFGIKKIDGTRESGIVFCKGLTPFVPKNYSISSVVFNRNDCTINIKLPSEYASIINKIKYTCEVHQIKINQGAVTGTNKIKTLTKTVNVSKTIKLQNLGTVEAYYYSRKDGRGLEYKPYEKGIVYSTKFDYTITISFLCGSATMLTTPKKVYSTDCGAIITQKNIRIKKSSMVQVH